MKRTTKTGRLRLGRLRPGRQSGQALLEMALVTPLLLALVLGVIELGRYAYFAILVENAARAGAAYGSQGLAYSVNSDGIRTSARQDFGSSDLTVNSTISCGCDISGDGGSCSVVQTCGSGPWTEVVSVEACAQFRPLFSYPGLPSGASCEEGPTSNGSVTVDRTVTMRVGQQ